MPDSGDQATPRQRRANWIGLRTLHQRPKVIGTSGKGGVSGVGEPEDAPAPSEPPALPVPKAQEEEELPAQAGSGGAESTAGSLERRFEAVAMRVEQLSRLAVAQQGQEERRNAEARTLAGLHEAMVKALADARAAAASASEGNQGRVTALAGQFRQGMDVLAKAVEDARAVTRSVSERSEARATGLDGQFRQGMEVLAKAVADARAEVGSVAEESEARTTALEGQMREGMDVLAKAVADARAEVRSVAEESEARATLLQAQIRQGLDALAQFVDKQQADLMAVVAEVGEARSEVQRVVLKNQELAEGQVRLEQSAAAIAEQAASSFADELSAVQAVVDQRLHELAAQVAQATARIDSLAYSTDDRTDRLDDRLDRLALQLASQRPEPAGVVVEEVDPEPEKGVELLEALEQQLARASDRLADLSAGSRRGSARSRSQP